MAGVLEQTKVAIEEQVGAGGTSVKAETPRRAISLGLPGLRQRPLACGRLHGL